MFVLQYKKDEDFYIGKNGKLIKGIEHAYTWETEEDARRHMEHEGKQATVDVIKVLNQ